MDVLRALLFILFLPALATAQTAVSQYVNTSCANNGDGTAANCAASGGATGAYNDCSSWESQNSNLVSDDDDLTVDFANEDCGERLVIAGWTTDATRNMTLQNLNISINLYDPTVHVNQVDYVTIQDATIEKTGEFPEGDVRAIRVQNADGFVLERSKIYLVSLTPDNSGGAVDVDSDGGSVDGTVIRNNIIYDCDDHCIDITFGDGDTIGVFNNTTVDATDTGIKVSEYNTGSGSTVNIYNNIAYGSGTDYSISVGSATYNNDDNLSQDTSSPNSAHRSKSLTFEDSGANDFHLASGDTDAIDLATDLSGSYSFSDDFDGDTRSGSWDIGADERAGGGGGSSAATILLLGDY